MSETTETKLCKPRLTVYFDGSCPLCRREIDFYRKRTNQQGLAWVDVSSATDLGDGLNCTVAMSRFHVRDAQGRLYAGGLAFAMLWQHVPGWRWLGKAFSHAPLSHVIDWAYQAFLPIRPKLQKLFGHTSN